MFEHSLSHNFIIYCCNKRNVVENKMQSCKSSLIKHILYCLLGTATCKYIFIFSYNTFLKLVSEEESNLYEVFIL